MDRSKWEYKKLGEVCLDFVVPQRDKPTAFDGDIPWCRIEDIEGRYLNGSKSGQNVTKELADRMNMHICPKGTVISACSASIGNQAITTVDCYTNQTFIGLVVNPELLYNEYLYYFLESKSNDLQKMGQGATIKYISKDKYKKMLIPLPSVYDQQRIVAELDCLNEMIAVKQEQLKEFDKLAQSIFYDMFGDPSHNEKQWELKSLKDISNEKLSYGSGASAISYDGQTRYIRITDINDKGELNDDIVSPSVYDEKYLLNDGDILFARSGATVGKTYCHNSKNGQCIYAGYLIRLVPNKELVLPSYVFSYTKTLYYRSFVEAAQRAVAQPNINAKQYGDLLICIPPLSLQQQFAEKISAIEAQKELVKQSIAETQQLFNSRMDYYFSE